MRTALTCEHFDCFSDFVRHWFRGIHAYYFLISGAIRPIWIYFELWSPELINPSVQGSHVKKWEIDVAFLWIDFISTKRWRAHFLNASKVASWGKLNAGSQYMLEVILSCQDWLQVKKSQIEMTVLHLKHAWPFVMNHNAKFGCVE
jgi:hypothetical protein